VKLVDIHDHITISCCRHRKGNLALQLVKERHHYSKENKAVKLWSKTRRRSPHQVNYVIKGSVISLMCFVLMLLVMNFRT
jgi:hypothetical protein